MYSNPPLHGALLVSQILKDNNLKQQWYKVSLLTILTLTPPAPPPTLPCHSSPLPFSCGASTPCVWYTMAALAQLHSCIWTIPCNQAIQSLCATFCSTCMCNSMRNLCDARCKVCSGNIENDFSRSVVARQYRASSVALSQLPQLPAQIHEPFTAVPA